MINDDKCGKHTIHKFISHIPLHYTRRDTRKEYIALELNISKLYDLYVEKRSCPIEVHFINTSTYHFTNLEKNNCNKCYKFEKLNDEEKDQEQQSYLKHIKRKDRVRHMKDD
ncbi:hypothetical protein PR048_001295 [Dryococelus australis]|uniref:Uncharacterized protein n=1 Tax=Dryococelus australis TaxID=614101 RepID=A0ABQ9IGY3_9NEOP|nr:hypothetical protein PR048_001295 [Dryococelus australis]